MAKLGYLLRRGNSRGQKGPKHYCSAGPPLLIQLLTRKVSCYHLRMSEEPLALYARKGSPFCGRPEEYKARKQAGAGWRAKYT